MALIMDKRTFATIKDRSLVTSFVADLVRLQNKFNEPFNDKAIMRIMDEWRGYSKRDTHYNKISDEEHTRRLAAYRSTNGDREAGEMVGISQARFYQWRHWHGLPAVGITRQRREGAA